MIPTHSIYAARITPEGKRQVELLIEYRALRRLLEDVKEIVGEPEVEGSDAIAKLNAIRRILA